MPENEFEKKVSSEMQELKFTPSEKVWPRVEERIRKKNKRRVFVIIFLLAGLALLGYWQRYNLFGEKKNEVAKIEQQKENNPETSEELNPSTTIKQNTEAPKENETKITIDKPANRSIINKKDIVVSKRGIDKPQDKVVDEIKLKPIVEKTKIEDKPEVLIDVVSAESKKDNPIVDNAKQKDTLVVKATIETTVKQDDVKQSEVKPFENKIDSTKAQIIVPEKIVTEKTDTLLKIVAGNESTPTIKKDSSKKKWKWGLHLTPGISTLNDHTISFGTLKSADALNYQGTASGTGAGAPPRQRPADVKPGFAFQAGIFAQRQLSTRTSLSLGLQYGFYSNRLRIGNRRDSLLNNSQFSSVLDGNQDHVYNAGGDTIRYTNRYHFIELPFCFQWQLNKSKANPFVWSTGFNVGQLITSNAMMYDTVFNGIYYRNKKQLNKTQFSLSTGFSWTIANGNGRSGAWVLLQMFT